MHLRVQVMLRLTSSACLRFTRRRRRRAADDAARDEPGGAARLPGLLPRPADRHRRQGRPSTNGPAAAVRRQRIDSPRSSKGTAPDGLDEVRGEFWDHRPDEGGRHPPHHLRPARRRSRSIRTAPWPRPGEVTAIIATAVAPPRCRRAAVDPRHRAEPVALPRSEGDDHRPVLRPQPARRPAGRARQEPLRLRAALRRRRHLGREHAAEDEGRERQGLRAGARRAHRHRPLADGARHGAAGARPAAARRRSRQPVAREAADGNASPRKSRFACPPVRRRR